MPKFFLILVATFPLLGGCNSPVFILEPFEARVVDAETGEPIEGAFVVANWALYEDTFLGQERFREQMEVKETQADANGRFAFAGFKKTNPRLLKLRGENPRVTIFKSGYEYSTWANSCPADGYACPTVKHLAKVAGQTVKLKKRVDGHKKLDRTYSPYFGLDIALYNILNSCNANKIPMMLEALTREHDVMEKSGFLNTGQLPSKIAIDRKREWCDKRGGVGLGETK